MEEDYASVYKALYAMTEEDKWMIRNRVSKLFERRRFLVKKMACIYNAYTYTAGYAPA